MNSSNGDLIGSFVLFGIIFLYPLGFIFAYIFFWFTNTGDTHAERFDGAKWWPYFLIIAVLFPNTSRNGD